MVSRRSGERAVDYFGSYVGEALATPLFLAFAGGASWLLRERVEATPGQVVLGGVLTCLLSVPLQLELKYLLHGSRPKPPYSVASQLTGDLVGRALAGAVGVGLVVQPSLAGAAIGAASGLLVSAVSILWLRPWKDEDDAEDLERAAQAFREEMNRGR